MKAVCPICPRHCVLAPGALGACRGRSNVEGRVISTNYGRLTAVALDPVEKKPLARFFPGSSILSVGSYGCNLQCPFCQNAAISMAGPDCRTEFISPAALCRLAEEMAAKPPGNIGVAFTYNEPCISYEYVLDTAKLLKAAGLKTVLVTNGMICREPLESLLPYVDAMNIDLKGFSQEYYTWLGGSFATVCETIRLAAAACHVEVTTLIVPGKNDQAADMEREASWLAGIQPDMPLHISRFFPRYQLQEREATPVETIMQLCRAARKYLTWVFPGNC